MRLTDGVEWWRDISAKLGDALASAEDWRIEALAAAREVLTSQLASAWCETAGRISFSLGTAPDPWTEIRAIVEETSGPGTFLGDYLCVANRSRSPDGIEALARLSTRLLGTDDGSAQAAVLLAISRACDAEPQTVRLGRLWVLDREGLKLEFVPIHHWCLDELATFEHYLRQIAGSALALDVRDVRDRVIEPLILGPKQKAKDLTAQPMTSIEEPSAPSAEEVVASHHAATRFLAILSVQERRVLNLTNDGLPPDQICVDLRIRPGTLKSVRHRIREKLLKLSGTL
jgi:DNA-directed RNA polymerase specialized sigma24 family protein